MRNICVLLAILISLTFTFVNGGVIKRGKYAKENYIKLRLLALQCKQDGDPIVPPKSCYKCACVSEGILECKPGPDCNDDEASQSQEEENNYSDEQFGETDTQAFGKKENKASKQKRLSKLSSQQFKDFRDAATTCNPGDEPLQEGCIVCNCVMKGIFSCFESKTRECTGPVTIPYNGPNDYM